MNVNHTNNIPPLNTYTNALRSICPELTDSEINFMLKDVSITELKAKELYLKPGDIQDCLAFSYKGLLRSYYINDKGEDITIYFVKENNYATDYGAFINQKPSSYFIETLEPCLLINLSYDSIQECYSTFKNCEKYGRIIAEKHLIRMQDRVNDFLFYNAEERYLNFISKHAEILHRISLTHLSSYLGMKRQTLTRIRKKNSTV